jgi:ribonuclease HI
LQGFRCYTDDAALSGRHPRPAGLGIFIVNPDTNPPYSIFITTSLLESTSVIMAESAALALVISLCRQMGLRNINFFTDNLASQLHQWRTPL